MLRLLMAALRGSPKPRAAMELMAEQLAAFKGAKAALGKAINLAYPKQGAELALMVDTSADHVGAALH
jgi:hypothetical protein